MAKKYEVVWRNGVSRRTAPTTSNSSTTLTPYAFGQVVDVLEDNIPDQTYPNDPSKKWVKFADGHYGASDYPDGSGPKVRMKDVTPAPPPADLPDLPYRIVLGGGESGYAEQVVEGMLKAVSG